MPNSVVIDGKVLDFHYKKRDDGYSYRFDVGDIYVGLVFKMRFGWSAVSSLPCDFGPVDGFRTRYDASAFLLKYQGIW